MYGYKDYRVYLFGWPVSGIPAPGSIEASWSFMEASDLAARVTAEKLNRRRPNEKCGFELWEGSRLVFSQRP